MCTLEKRGRVYLLTLTGAGEHRLNPTLFNSISSALAQVRSDYAASGGGGGAALVTAAEGKFFSNGLDLAWVRASPSDRLNVFSASIKNTIADIMALPMPTVAAVTGHATGGACGIVVAHDYIVMRRDRGFFCLSELQAGISIPSYFAAAIRSKIRDPSSLRRLLLQSAKVAAVEGLEMGFIDRAVVGAAETVAAAVEMAEELAGKGWDGGIYASIRQAMFPGMSHAVPAVRLNMGEEASPPTVETEKALNSRL